MAKAKTRVAGRRSHLCQQCRGDILPGQKYRLKGRQKIHHDPDCAHAEPVEFWTPRPIKEDPFWKWSSPARWRFVRSYEVEMARRDYSCYECDNGSWHQQSLSTIYAGDPYRVEIWVSRIGWEIRRFHDWCPDPYDPTEEKDFYKEDEKPKSSKAA